MCTKRQWMLVNPLILVFSLNGCASTPADRIVAELQESSSVVQCSEGTCRPWKPAEDDGPPAPVVREPAPAPRPEVTNYWDEHPWQTLFMAMALMTTGITLGNMDNHGTTKYTCHNETGPDIITAKPHTYQVCN
jgi:hypothetical protein